MLFAINVFVKATLFS